MKKLSSIVMGDSNSPRKLPDFMKLEKHVSEKLYTIFNGAATVMPTNTFSIGADIKLRTSVKENKVTLAVYIGFEVPDSTDDSYDLNHTSIVIKRLGPFEVVVPSASLESEEEFKKFYYENLDNVLNPIITAVKQEKSVLEQALRYQAILALISENNYSKEQLEEAKKQVNSMSMEDLLSRKTPLDTTMRVTFPVVGFSINSTIDGDLSLKTKEDLDQEKNRADLLSAKSKVEEPGAKSKTQTEEKTAAKIEELPSRSQNQLEEQTIKAEQKAEAPVPQSPIVPPVESKTIIENNKEKEKTTENTIIKESTSSITKIEEPLLDKKLETYTDKELKDKGLQENDILMLRLFDVFNKQPEKKETKTETKTAQKKSEGVKSTTSPSVVKSESSTTTTASTSSESIDEVSSVIKETNSQLLDQSLIQTVILSSLNDSMSSLKDTMQAYINVSDKSKTSEGSILNTVKDVISLKTSDAQNTLVDKTSTQNNVNEMASLVPNIVKSVAQEVTPILNLSPQKNNYNAVENKVFSTEANTISKNDVTKLGENLDNSIKTAVTNSSIVNNTNIEGTKATSEPAPVIPVPNPSNSALIQDNSVTQGTVGSGAPSTVNLSNATIDNIANAFVKALTLTPFLNYGK